MEVFYTDLRLEKKVMPHNNSLPDFRRLTPDNPIWIILYALLEDTQSVVDFFSEDRLLTPNKVYPLIWNLAKSFRSGSIQSGYLTDEEKVSITEDYNEKYFFYDQYFDTVRYDFGSGLIFIDQFLLAVANQLEDVANSCVAVSEIIIGINGIKEMLEILISFAPNDVSKKERFPLIPNDDPSNYLHTSDEDAALIRWKVGHSSFAFNLIFSNYALEGFINDFCKVELLRAASNLFRASTAAMWFSSIFTANMYQNVIRPSMGKGFSGHQNFEFAHWYQTKETMLSEIKEALILPLETKNALSHFANYYLEDGEQHVLLAATMVKQEPSLLQDEISMAIGLKTSVSAVSILRDVLDRRKEEVAFIYQL